MLVCAIVCFLSAGKLALDLRSDFMDTQRQCAAAYSAQFDNPSSDKVWTSPACARLTRKQQGEIYIQTVIAYQERDERNRP